LGTINIREEEEKLNIWVAYFNLENKYGNPPEVNLVHFIFVIFFLIWLMQAINWVLLPIYRKLSKNNFRERYRSVIQRNCILLSLECMRELNSTS
jgi:rRNA biogenesis protein RRP5